MANSPFGDRSKPARPTIASSSEHSESHTNGAILDTDHATPEAKRSGYGHSAGNPSAPTGGHNYDAKHQYTVKLPRGSSL